MQTLIAGDKLELKFGAQDLSQHDSGAYTGEISGAFLAALAASAGGMVDDPNPGLRLVLVLAALAA